MAVAVAPTTKAKNPSGPALVRFNRSKDKEFFKTLKSRVDQYFKSNNITRYADWRMKVKTVAMFAIYFVPFALLFTPMAANTWVFFGLWIMMGFGVAGIGLSIMHDANHGSYSRNTSVNKMMSLALNVVGGLDTTWRIQHNVLHHTYTNVSGLDEDINQGPLLRLSPHDKLMKHHKYQWMYVWALYSLLSLFWIVWKDFKQIVQYNRRGLLATQRTSFAKEMGRVLITKAIYYAYILALPIALGVAPWYMIIAGWVIMHMVTGITLSLIFQSAHVVEGIAYAEPDENNVVDEHWAVQQIKSTANFARNNRLLSWYVGGLNYQIEHHLFPNICHVHYREISKIVEDVANEYNLPYRSEVTFAKAVGSHVRQLRALGRA